MVVWSEGFDVEGLRSGYFTSLGGVTAAVYSHSTTAEGPGGVGIARASDLYSGRGLIKSVGEKSTASA